MRGQLIVREGQYFLWSRGEELITDKFPELAAFANHLPSGTVLDGEILPYPQGVIGNFNDLQKRIGRKTVGAKLLQDVPIRFMIYDLLEWEGIYRTTPLHIRQEQLALLYQSHKKFDLPWELSQVLHFATWEAVAQEREKAEQKRSEGLMLKKGLLLCSRAEERKLVEMEVRPQNHRCRAYLCNARTRSPNEPLYRLYFCSLG